MCNAANHSPACNCGFGGVYYGGGGGFLGQTSLSHVISLSPPSPSVSAIGKQPAVIRDAETYPTTCWWCGAEVYYHTNGYGDSVLFDALGYPWQIHPCWTDYWKGQKALRKGLDSIKTSTEIIIRRIEQYEKSGYSSSYQIMRTQASHKHLNDQRMAILAGAIKQIRFIPDEFSVANRMDITLAELRKDYSDLYTIDPSNNGIKLKDIAQFTKAKEPQKTSKTLPLQVLAIQKPRKHPPKPKKRK